MIEMTITNALKRSKIDANVKITSLSDELPPTGNDMRPLDQWRLCVSFFAWQQLVHSIGSGKEDREEDGQHQILIRMKGDPLRLELRFDPGQTGK